MTLEQLRAALREKHGALEALHAKAFLDDASDDDVGAYEDGVKEAEGLLVKIDLAERAEKIKAQASVPAAAPVSGQSPERKAAARLLEKIEPDRMISLAAAGVIKAGKNASQKEVLKALDDGGFGVFAEQLEVSTKAVNTLVSSEGGILVPTPLSGGIMPILRTRSSFIDAGPNRVTLVNGQFVLPRGLAGSSAAYVAEGALKPVSTPTFDSVSMRAKKLAGVVPLTNEARMWTVGDIENYVRTDLRDAMAVTMDLNAWLGTGSGSSPLGILNKSGVQTFTPTITTATAPTLAELDRLATGLILKLTTANIFANGNWRWVMSYRTAMFLQDIRDGNGNPGFPEMSLGRAGGPLWKGFPVTVTSQIPINGGGTTDETTLALVDFTHVLFGEEEGITVKMSDQATLNTTGATNGTGLVHLWQQNMFAILAESMHDFGLRTALAVVKATIRF